MFAKFKHNAFWVVLYESIDQIPPNILHGPMHYKIGVICVYNGHVMNTIV